MRPVLSAHPAVQASSKFCPPQVLACGPFLIVPHKRSNEISGRSRAAMCPAVAHRALCVRWLATANCASSSTKAAPREARVPSERMRQRTGWQGDNVPAVAPAVTIRPPRSDIPTAAPTPSPADRLAAAGHVTAAQLCSSRDHRMQCWRLPYRCREAVCRGRGRDSAVWCVCSWRVQATPRAPTKPRGAPPTLGCQLFVIMTRDRGERIRCMAAAGAPLTGTRRRRVAAITARCTTSAVGDATAVDARTAPERPLPQAPTKSTGYVRMGQGHAALARVRPRLRTQRPRASDPKTCGAGAGAASACGAPRARRGGARRGEQGRCSMYRRVQGRRGAHGMVGRKHSPLRTQRPRETCEWATGSAWEQRAGARAARRALHAGATRAAARRGRRTGPRVARGAE